LYVVIWSLQLVVGTVVSPILAYVMGPAEFGSLASALALFQVLSVLAILGIDQALVLQHAEDGERGVAAKGLVTVGIVISIIVTAIFILTSPLWQASLGFSHNEGLVLAVSVWAMPAAGVQLTLALLLAEDRLRPFAIVSVIAAVGGQVVGVLLLVLVENSPVIYVWGCVGSQTVAMLLGIIAVRPALRGLINWPVTWRAIRLGVPLALGGLAYFVLNAGDRIVIQRMLGVEEVGRYQVAYVVGSTVILLLTFTSTAWTPRFAAVHSEKERWLLAAEARDELYRILMPIVLGLTLASPVLLRIVAPPSFRPESLTLVVFLVALAAFPFAASVGTGRLLITLRRGKTIGAITGVVAVVNIVLNILWVPQFGVAGAALATLVSYGLLAFLQLRVLPKSPEWQGPSSRLVVGIIVTVALTAGSVLLPQTLEWNIARFAIGLCCLPWAYMRLKSARQNPDLRADNNEKSAGQTSLRIVTDARWLTQYGGIEKSTVEDTAMLSSRGHEVFLLYEEDGPQRAEYERAGVKIFGPVVFGLAPRRIIRNYWRAARMARRLKPDVLWLNRSEHIIWAQFVARVAGVPIVCHVHQLPNFRLTRFLYTGVTSFVAVSEFIRDSWIARGIPPSKITVVHNAVSLEQYPFGGSEEKALVRQELEIPRDIPVVMYYGRVSVIKGVLTLIEAWRQLGFGPEQGLLLLIGWAPDEEQQDILHALESLPAGSYRWLPGQEDVVPYLHAADVVAVPSMIEEAFGRVVIEALSTGRPVVASRVGGIPEILLGSMSRFLVPVGDSAQLAEGLRGVLLWRQREPELGRAARALVEERFPYDAHIARLEQILLSARRTR
jgi:glycosyltransferase involved in cell wall biosynthesis/O-antigen/teichoic acid export membrane protein